jgi:E3 ubiquitin-protein ligase HUWE1
LDGFYEIIPKDLISIFTYKELELLISGQPDFKISDLKKHTRYGGYTEHSP